MENYFQYRIAMSTKQKIGIEDVGQTEALRLEAIQVAILGIISKKLDKAQKKRQKYKHEIVEAIQKVGEKVEQPLQVLETKIDKIELNMSQLNGNVLP